MARQPQTVLVDTNTIIECHRVGCWRAVAGRFAVETVEQCVTETQTGFQNRRPEEAIDQSALVRSLHRVHPVTKLQHTTLELLYPDAATLDPGERDLWAHAVSRIDAWHICGPDKASLQAGYALNRRDSLTTLEDLLEQAGFQNKIPLRPHHGRAWHRNRMAELAMNAGRFMS